LPRADEHRLERRQFYSEFYRHRFRHIHFRVVFPVALRKRRKHRDAVSAIRQRADHRAHKVPMALAGHRLDG